MTDNKTESYLIPTENTWDCVPKKTKRKPKLLCENCQWSGWCKNALWVSGCNSGKEKQGEE